MENRKILNVNCDCKFEPAHDLQFMYFTNEDYHKEIYFTKYMNTSYNFIQRIWVALKYIFGYNNYYGHFSETILNKKEVIKLKNYLDEFLI